MDDGIFSVHAPSFASDMDFTYMNEILGDDCWLQGSDFLHQFSSDSSNMLNSPFVWSPCDAFLCENIFGQPRENNEEQFVRSSLPGSTCLDESLSGDGSKIQETDGCFGETEIGKNRRIGPSATSGLKISVMDRLVRAIGFIKEATKDRDVLIQMWMPRDLNGKRVLTTNDQPYIVDFSSPSLASYRTISLNFQFSAERNSNMVEGMPGRVFLGEVPEWTPDVRFFRSDEYARVGYAQTFNVRGTLALPVFDHGSQTCLGVIEVITTTRTVKAELDSVCEALQAVDLSSTVSQSTEKAKTCTQSYQAALPDILEVMKSACLTHNLPLAQTWMSCVQQGKEGCRHSTENYIHCVSTVDSACYVFDPNVQGFHESCSEHHLLRGQGVAGKAFTTNEPCFYDDITSFCKTDYPLAHHARVFGLHAAVAIRLRSVHTGATDFVLEFYLPTDCRDPEEHKKMLGSLSLIIQKTGKSLRVVTDNELAKDSFTSNSVAALEMNYEKSTVSGSVITQSHHAVSFIQKEEPTEFVFENSSVIQSNPIGPIIEDYDTFGEGTFRNPGRQGGTKRNKAEHTITLEVLQRHFAGSLKEAAKNLGVCPTTLKRICRNQGIKRWPSRKIKKVGNSLEKLQRVIDSVQGPSGSFQIGSFYSCFPELASPSSKSGITHKFSASNVSTITKSLPVQLEVNSASPLSTSISPASPYSQSSSSSQSCSSATHHRTSSWNSTRTEDAGTTITECFDDVALKRMRSDAHLNQMGLEDPTLLPRSQSLVTLARTSNSESLQHVPKNTRKELDGTRVKVTYGDEKIRMRMRSCWQVNDLRQEIARRFHLDGSSTEMQLKYLDDDSEWVLITCDADWEECVDVCLSSSSNTIKLSLHAPHHHLGNSFLSSSAP